MLSPFDFDFYANHTSPDTLGPVKIYNTKRRGNNPLKLNKQNFINIQYKKERK